MVRRTKADAEVTRHRLLDAAEALFQAKGVSGTSLQDIATAAGATRGAVYWHFKDKADLFNAMMDRATLPLECGFADHETRLADLSDPLDMIRQGMRHVLHLIATDERLRRVFVVATHQVEYNTEMATARERQLRIRDKYLGLNAETLRLAAQHQQLKLPMAAESAALGLHVVVDGLLHNWLLDTQRFDLSTVGPEVIDTYLRGLGFSLAGAAQAPHPAASAPATSASDARRPRPSDSQTPARSRTRTA